MPLIPLTPNTRNTCPCCRCSAHVTALCGRSMLPLRLRHHSGDQGCEHLARWEGLVAKPPALNSKQARCSDSNYETAGCQASGQWKKCGIGAQATFRCRAPRKNGKSMACAGSQPPAAHRCHRFGFCSNGCSLDHLSG